MKKTEKHKKHVPKHGQQLINFTSTPRLSRKFEDGVKKAELHLAATIACHSSIRSVDHLGEKIACHGSRSVRHTTKLHRTKCVGLIKNVRSCTCRY